MMGRRSFWGSTQTAIAVAVVAVLACSASDASASSGPPDWKDGSEAIRIADWARRASPLAAAGLAESSTTRFTDDGVASAGLTVVRNASPKIIGPAGPTQMVYGDESAPNSTIAQRITGGGRILEIIRGSTSQKHFTYDLQVPGSSKILADPGGDDLLVGERHEAADGTVTVDVTQVIGAPWAVDRNGKTLPATYTLSGSKLTLDVDTTGAKFPVMADPTWTSGGFRASWSTFNPTSAVVLLNKARTDDAADGQIVGCGLFALIPGVGVWLAASCAVWAYLIKTTVRIAGYCARFDVSAFHPTRPRLTYYKGGFCT
jgi:hypothetical protein